MQLYPLYRDSTLEQNSNCWIPNGPDCLVLIQMCGIVKCCQWCLCNGGTCRVYVLKEDNFFQVRGSYLVQEEVRNILLHCIQLLGSYRDKKKPETREKFPSLGIAPTDLSVAEASYTAFHITANSYIATRPTL